MGQKLVGTFDALRVPVDLRPGVMFGESLDARSDHLRQLFKVLAERFPSLGSHLEDGMAVALNGHIFQDAWFEPIPDHSEVHLLPALAGR